MVLDFVKLKNYVIETGLCARCGTCIGICPQDCIEADDRLYPSLKEGASCNSCGICFKACPGHDVPFSTINKALHGKTTTTNDLLGIFKKIYIGHALDPSIRENSGSGGAISALLVFILDEEGIDGAIVVRMNKEKPWLPEVVVARTREEVLEAAQSKYTIVPVNAVLRNIRQGSYVFVGLPCQVHGLRKAMTIDKKLSKRIKYVIGNYCGLNTEYDATKAVVDKFGVDYKDIKKFEYRGGKWPGGMKITLKDDSTFFLPKFHSNYLTPMYYAKRCLLCIDLSNELADISVGDGWLMESKDGGGWSTIIGRTERGLSLLKEAERKGVINLNEISYEDATMSHSHGLDMKKKGAFIRIENRVKKGKAFPKYGFKMPGVTLKRRVDEYIFSFYMWFNSLGITKWIIKKIPFSVLGFYYVKLRGFWKKKTHYN